MNVEKLLMKLYSEFGTWRQVAEFIGGLTPAYWRAVANGEKPCSLRAENLLRRKFNLPRRRKVRRLDDYTRSELAWLIKHREPII